MEEGSLLAPLTTTCCAVVTVSSWEIVAWELGEK